MSVIFRAIERHEESEAMTLWTTVFNCGEWLFQSNLDAETERALHQTLVAVEDGKIVASVQYFIRHTRWLDGTVCKMGAIANVATYEEARKKGYSGKLLELAIENMAKDGCSWSLLFTGVNAHYERYGWKTLKTRYRQGLLNDKQETLGEWRVLPVNPAADKESLAKIAEVYDVSNQTRLLTNLRTAHYWETAVLPRMTGPNSVTYTACLGDCRKVAAYVVASTDEHALVVKEAGFVPGCEEALLATMDVVRELAVHREVDKVRVYLPYEEEMDKALDRLVKGVETGFHGHAMARPLVDSLSFEQIQDCFLAEKAIIWPLDDF